MRKNRYPFYDGTGALGKFVGMGLQALLFTGHGKRDGGNLETRGIFHKTLPSRGMKNRDCLRSEEL
jgi:hypothetical protein